MLAPLLHPILLSSITYIVAYILESIVNRAYDWADLSSMKRSEYGKGENIGPVFVQSVQGAIVRACS